MTRLLVHALLPRLVKFNPHTNNVDDIVGNHSAAFGTACVVEAGRTVPLGTLPSQWRRHVHPLAAVHTPHPRCTPQHDTKRKPNTL